MSKVDPTHVAHRLAERGYNVDPAAASLLADAEDPEAAIEATLSVVAADALKVTVADVPAEVAGAPAGPSRTPAPAGTPGPEPAPSSGDDPLVRRNGGARDPEPVAVAGDVTDRSTGTGEYADFVALFRDRYERLSTQLRGRITSRTARSLDDARGGAEAGIVGLVNDIRTTRNGHRLIELEDRTGPFPVLVLNHDEDLAPLADELLYDEVIGVEGRLSDDAGVLFAESIAFPDVPRTNRPTTADRPVQAALISDIHVGSEEFLEDAWHDFADWLGTEEARRVEYLLIAGDMVEGVGVYPGQDADLAIVDIFEQYRQFSEVLKDVPGDLEVVMISGNHDAVRLAEPQPAIDEDLRSCLDAHDAEIVGNPSTVTVEGVEILMYHGTSLDEVIASVPVPEVSYQQPDQAMKRLLRKRHLAPPYGGRVRIAPEERDYLVIDDVPDVFHAGHVHTIGVGEYRGVRIVNSGCWQAQTAFQRRNNLDPDPGFAPILDLDTLEVTLRKFT